MLKAYNLFSLIPVYLLNCLFHSDKKQMTYANKKYTAAVIGISIVVFLWTAHLFSFFSLPNGYSYDAMIRSYSPAEASDQIIVIEMDSSFADRGDDVWLALLNKLLEYDVKQIAFSFLPEQASEQFYQLAVDSKKTVFGVQFIKHSEDSEQDILLIPQAVTNKKIVYGLISTFPSQGGVYREQHGVIKANSISFSAFEKRVAEEVLADLESLPDNDFRVNFIGNQNRIPRIRIERVLSGGLISELVSGRTVLIGVNKYPIRSRYYTPVSTDQHLTSEVLFHAFALDTLLSDRQISVFSSWAFLILIILITGASLFFCQWLTFQMSMTVSMISTLMYVLVCGVTLHVFFIWIPVTELLLAQWLTFTLVWRYRLTQEKQSLDQMLLGLSLKLREKVKPISFYRTDEPWEQLISMINQSLHLNRLIFLERVQGDHRLKEITALNCSINDIKEMRRDYERTPYSTAISENRPILLEQDYLTAVDIDEQQYMAPLVFAGDILGFWVFTVSSDIVVSKAKFNTLTQAFMVQISEILHYRQQWQKRMQIDQSKLWSYLRVEGGAEHLHQMNQSVVLLDKRNSELHEVFNSIKTSCILYDLFGRVLLVNKYMEEFAQSVNLRLFNITMLEFIVEITGNNVDYARNLLQQIIFDHESISIPVIHGAMNRSYMLHMRPLKNQDERIQDELIPDESQVFQISGVLCELVDMTELKSLYQLKEKMFERFSFQVRNDLSSILFGLSILDDQQSSKDEKQFVLENIQGKVDETLNMLEVVKKQMDVEIESMVTHTLLCYPVDGRLPLQRAVAQLKNRLEQREINIHLQLPELISLVFASPQELEVVLHAVLLAMIEDTYEAGEIWIEVEEKEQNVFYHIYNKGIGISDNKLQTFEESGLTEESEILKFHYAIRCVNRWGGSLNITSQMGEGSRAELLLRRFM